LAEEDPIILPPMPPTTPGPGFIICRGADDSEKPVADEKTDPSQRCSVGGGPMIPGPGSGGGGGGGGGGGAMVQVGNILISAYNWAQFAVNLHSLTWNWAQADVERFRLAGLHVANPQGSLIPWQNAMINWNLFGANDPDLSAQQVVQNFVNAMSGGGGG
jgi:hypothetical protein